jgi:hypothetical protein
MWTLLDLKDPVSVVRLHRFSPHTCAARVHRSSWHASLPPRRLPGWPRDVLHWLRRAAAWRCPILHLVWTKEASCAAGSTGLGERNVRNAAAANATWMGPGSGHDDDVAVRNDGTLAHRDDGAADHGHAAWRWASTLSRDRKQASAPWWFQPTTSIATTADLAWCVWWLRPTSSAAYHRVLPWHICGGCNVDPGGRL